MALAQKFECAPGSLGNSLEMQIPGLQPFGIDFILWSGTGRRLFTFQGFGKPVVQHNCE